MQNMEASSVGDLGRKLTRKKSRQSRSRDRSKARHGRITFYHCGKLEFKREQNEKNTTNNNNIEEAIAIAIDSEAIIIVSYEV